MQAFRKVFESALLILLGRWKKFGWSIGLDVDRRGDFEVRKHRNRE
jgi:hypothetical protein